MQPDNVDEILQAKATLGNYLKEKCYSKHYQHFSFKYIPQDNNFWKNF